MVCAAVCLCVSLSCFICTGLQAIPDVARALQYHTTHVQDPDFMRDVYDGELWRELDSLVQQRVSSSLQD